MQARLVQRGFLSKFSLLFLLLQAEIFSHIGKIKIIPIGCKIAKTEQCLFFDLEGLIYHFIIKSILFFCADF
jgi:hypothetical protein